MKSVSLAILIAFLIALEFTPAVHATPPTPAAGTLVLTSLTTGYLTGTFEGTFDTALVQGQIERLRATGCVGSACGAVTFYIVNPVPNGLGYWTLQEGTGDLTGLRGQGTWSIDMTTFQGPYEGQIHFEP